MNPQRVERGEILKEPMRCAPQRPKRFRPISSEMGCLHLRSAGSYALALLSSAEGTTVG
jgi:hypothetical protein